MTYVNTTVTCATSVSATRALSLAMQIRLAIAAHGQRRALRGLDANALRDIGITRAQADREASRRLWDVPANWRQ